MDRQWMGCHRFSPEYLQGVEEFLSFARSNIVNPHEGILCPCIRCANQRSYSADIVRLHLISNGIMISYKLWYHHGEVNFQTSFGPGRKDFFEKQPEDDVGDNMCDMVNDLEDDFVSRPDLFESMMEDAETPLYNGCKNFTKMSFLVTIFNLKAKGGWSNASFTELLRTLRLAFPEDNKVLSSFYEAKKILSTLGMKYQRIHACVNDCILYRNDYEDKDACPVCNKPRWKKGKKPSNGVKGVPEKVLWYIPPIPRFRRLFNNAEHAKNLLWHSEKRLDDGMLRHPADAAQWKSFDAEFPDFSSDPRNLRLGLASDGMNPFGNMSSRYSVWPVILVNYNLPPELCMKRKFMMLTLVISGPSQPGNDIDVYLEPLVDDLKLLWEEGVEMNDAYRKELFKLRAMLMWTINDFPAYGNLSGYSVKCSIGCPVCMKETSSVRLKHGRKTVFLSHRRFLPRDHPYRKLRQAFDGNTEERPPPRILSGEEVYDMVKDVDVVLGKRKRSATNKESLADNPWKKRSIFYNLPYWRLHYVRHCLDPMHIEKNVCESILGTLLDDPNKTKDGKKARLDLKEMKIRSNLHLEERGKYTFMPPAKYTLSRQEKRKLCEWFSSIKVPDGHSANIRGLVSLKDLRLIGMKSHDCHVMLQQFLPLALRGISSKEVKFAISKLCSFFNSICEKVINPSTLDSLQAELVKTVCMLEKFFPPSFFDIMVHLVVHLVREVKLGGPVFLRWMYPIERYMKVLKSYVKNRNRAEGCIVENYISEESIEFCSEYLANPLPIGLPVKKNSESTSLSSGKPIMVKRIDWEQATLHVLHNSEEVVPFIDVHMNEIRTANPKKAMKEKWVQEEHNRSFQKWLGIHISKATTGSSKDLVKLSQAPSFVVMTYTSWSSNGYTFYTRERDNKHPVQNSGVTIRAECLHVSSAKDKNAKHGFMNYYGYIEEIWVLDYSGLRIPLLKCKWADNKFVKVDRDGVTIVDFRRLGYANDPFILVSQAVQVFYVSDPADSQLSLVVHTKSRNFDHSLHDDNDNLPSFTKGLPSVEDIDNFDDDVSQLRRLDIDSVRIEN